MADFDSCPVLLLFLPEMLDIGPEGVVFVCVLRRGLQLLWIFPEQLLLLGGARSLLIGDIRIKTAESLIFECFLGLGAHRLHQLSSIRRHALLIRVSLVGRGLLLDALEGVLPDREDPDVGGPDGTCYSISLIRVFQIAVRVDGG